MAVPQNKKRMYLLLSVTVLLITYMTGAVSAQTFNPQQPPDFGNFNGTRPDFGGNPPDFNGSQGFPGGDFNGTFPGRGDGNFTRPDFSGAPNQYNANNDQSPQAVNEPTTDYTFIIAAVIVVLGIVAVATAVLTRKNKSKAGPPPPPVGTEHFDF